MKCKFSSVTYLATVPFSQHVISSFELSWEDDFFEGPPPLASEYSIMTNCWLLLIPDKLLPLEVELHYLRDTVLIVPTRRRSMQSTTTVSYTWSSTIRPCSIKNATNDHQRDGKNTSKNGEIIQRKNKIRDLVRLCNGNMIATLRCYRGIFSSTTGIDCSNEDKLSVFDSLFKTTGDKNRTFCYIHRILWYLL